MNRIIINNRSSCNDKTVLNVVSRVISAGRISDNGKSYCYVTTLDCRNLAISAKRNKASDTFTAYDSPPNKEI